FSPEDVRKLLAGIRSQNKPGSVRPRLIGKFVAFSADALNESILTDPNRLAQQLREQLAGPDDNPWENLFPNDDVNHAQMDPLMFELPVDLWANELSEVGTIVWLRWLKQAVGSYKSDGTRAPAGASAGEPGKKPRKAYQWCVAVVLIERASGDVRDVVTYAGKDPPEKIAADATQGVGPKPNAAVLKHLNELPRD